MTKDVVEPCSQDPTGSTSSEQGRWIMLQRPCRRMAPRSTPDTEGRGGLILLRGPWRGVRQKTKREQRRASTRRPGWRAGQWAKMLEDGVYESRAALARGEGVSRAAVTQALQSR